MRSLLFVPGHDERKLARALESGADALIVDLEDAVPPAEKARAREIAAEFVKAHHAAIPLYVRVNSLDTGLTLADLAAVVRANPRGIMLPKCGQGLDVARVAAYLSALETRDGIAPESIQVLPIVTESAAAVLEAASYAKEAGARLCAMMWGGEDLAADVGSLSNRDAHGAYTAPFVLARSLTLLGASAAQVPAIDAVYTDFRDARGLRAQAAEALRDGFSAKAAIHPDQVGPINEAFTPAEEDRAWARRVVDAFALQPGAGAIALDGKMLDRPHLRSAQRVLARAVAGH